MTLDTAIAAGTVHDYTAKLVSGESINLIVDQIGVDLIIEARDPSGSLIGTFDSPNGRNGPEPVEVIASASGNFVIRVRPFDAREPAGKYHLAVVGWRSRSETASMLNSRKLARDSAAAWIKRRSAPIPATGTVRTNGSIPPLDSLALRARVIGLGEATHGSREFNDFRLSVTRRLIERYGFRVVGIEASAARLEVMNKYIAGNSQEGTLPNSAIEWIGGRSRRELVRWLRQWNAAHASDRVELVGLDPQENMIASDSLRAFLSRAYGPQVVARLAPMFRDFAAADSQSTVFANSDVDSTTRMASLELVATLELDAPGLTQRFGASAVEAARAAARQLAQFAEFNSGGAGLLNRSRDYFMASNLMAAINRRGAATKGMYWAHNTHVAHPEDQSERSRTTGGWLRDWLGCGYAVIGAAFREGSFVAQLPNDLTDRLAISTLPTSPSESIDAVLGAAHDNAAVVSWGCSADTTTLPSWLKVPHAMHWAGALYTPGSPPSDAFRSFNLVKDFDGVVYFPVVSADEMPIDRPLIPARKR